MQIVQDDTKDSNSAAKVKIVEQLVKRIPQH